MIYATFDIDWMDDPIYHAMHDADPAHVLRFLRCIVWAKRANCKGRIIRNDGIPFSVQEMSRIHDGRGEKYVQQWQKFLDLAINIGCLFWDEEHLCYCVTDWRRWHRKPSDEPGETAKRKALQRCHAMSRDVTRGHACHATEQSRAEQSKAEQSPPSPQGENGGGEFFESEIDNQGESDPSEPPFARRVQEILGVKPTKRELAQAKELLNSPLPIGWSEAGWRKAIIDELKRQIKAVNADLIAGKPIARPTAIAIGRADVQLQRAARLPEERPA